MMNQINPAARQRFVRDIVHPDVQCPAEALQNGLLSLPHCIAPLTRRARSRALDSPFLASSLADGRHPGDTRGVLRDAAYTVNLP